LEAPALHAGAFLFQASSSQLQNGKTSLLAERDREQ